MYFCRLISMLLLALFSSLSWSVADFQLMPSGSDALPDSQVLGNTFDIREAQLHIKSSHLQESFSAPPKHSYPLSLKVAGATVEAKQEIFGDGSQVLSFDLSSVQKTNTHSDSFLPGFQQLVLMLSRSTTKAVMRFYPLTKTAKIEVGQLHIQTELTEEKFIRRDLPELLTAKATSQLLQAVECGLNNEVVVGQSVTCPRGVLERLDEHNVFFEASENQDHTLPEWQVQANSSDFVELVNGTTRLTLTLDGNGAIVKGDVVSFDEPADMMDEESDKESGKGSSNGDSGNNSDNGGDEQGDLPSSDPGDSASGGDQGGDKDKNGPPKDPSPETKEEEDDDEEADEVDGKAADKSKKQTRVRQWEDEQEDSEFWHMQNQLLDGIDAKRNNRKVKLKSQRRSDHQQSRLKKITGSQTDPAKQKPKPKKSSKAYGGTTQR